MCLGWATFDAEPKKTLLLYVKSKIVDKAREQINIHCNLTSWDEISALLLSLYQDRKSMDQLLEDLKIIKQLPSESVSNFYQRLEDLSSRILAIIHSTEENQQNLNERLLMITDMALNRFIYHTHPQISQTLRYRAFTNINCALTTAIAEEEGLGPQYRTLNNYDSLRNRSVNFNQTPPLKDRYCKKCGQSLEECRQRQYNNSQYMNRNSYNNQLSSSNLPQQRGNYQPSKWNGNPNNGNVNFHERNFRPNGLNHEPTNPQTNSRKDSTCFSIKFLYILHNEQTHLRTFHE